MITQQLFIVAMVMIGGYLGMRFRKMDISGLEFYLAFGILATYAYSPFWGAVVGSAMMLVALVLYPRGIERFWIPVVCMAATFYLGARYLPMTQGTFVMNSMILVIGYNVISNLAYMLTGYDWFRAFRFIVISSFLNFIILSRIGWDLLQWLS